MDNFVRRQGYSWDGRRNMYYLPEEGNNGRCARTPSSAKSKAGEVILQFSKGEQDSKEIARALGFDGNRDLAIYMTTKGYLWDEAKGNYILGSGAD